MYSWYLTFQHLFNISMSCPLMDRRQVLHAFGLGVAGVGLSGCNTTGDEATATRTATSTPTVTPTIDPASVPTASSLDEWHFDLDGAGQQEDPEVSFQAGTNTVIVEGAERAGDSECGRISLGTLDYWDGILHVEITTAPTHNPKTTTPACLSDVDFGYYRLAVTFSDGFPDQVIVKTSAENDSHTFERPE